MDLGFVDLKETAEALAVTAEGLVEDGIELAAQITQAVRRETGWSIRDLTVEITREGVLLKGHCETYHCKQMAQHAAMMIPGGDRLVNAIEVVA